MKTFPFSDNHIFCVFKGKEGNPKQKQEAKASIPLLPVKLLSFPVVLVVFFYGWQSPQMSGLCTMNTLNTLNTFDLIDIMFSSPFCAIITQQNDHVLLLFEPLAISSFFSHSS